MTLESSVILERLLRDYDLGWMIDMYSPRDRAVPDLLNKLERLTDGFRSRFGHDVSFSPETLRAEAERNPHKARAFLQALGTSGNQDMLLMVWRILQGMTIRDVKMDYREQESFSLIVTLARTSQEHDDLEEYHTNDIKDAALLRHFGIMKVDSRPLFDGFFPLRKS